MNFKGPAQILLRRRISPFLILLIALFFTILASYVIYIDGQADYNNRLDRTQKRIQQTIESRMNVYINALIHTRSFLEASKDIKRNLFTRFTEGMQLHENYPGLLALCYIKKIAPENLKKHTAEMHAEGFTNYKVWPDSNLDLRTSIYFIEPFNETNQKAFGFDMMTEPIRREAMLAARDSGLPTVTHKIKLVQDQSKKLSDKSNGFIIFVPMYASGLPTQTIEQRRKALVGFVSSPFRAEELFSQILLEENYLRDMITFKVFDGASTGSDQALFDPTSQTHSMNQNNRQSIVQVANQQWTIVMHPLSTFGSDSARNSHWYVFILGTLTSLLLFILSLASHRHHRRILSSQNQLRLITDTLPALISYMDRQLRYRFVNKGYLEWFGRPESEMLGHTAPELFGDEIDQVTKACRQSALNGKAATMEMTLDHEKMGPRQMQVHYIPDQQEQIVQGIVILATDVTDQKASEQKIKDQARIFEVINQVVLSLQAETDIKNIVQLVTDSATEVTKAQFGAFFYNAQTINGDSLTLYTISGVPKENFTKFPIPRKTNIFAPTFDGEKVMRFDDVTKSEAYGKNSPFHGLPPGHLPVRSYLAVPVISRSKEVLGGLYFGHAEAGVFTEQSEKIVLGIAAQAAVAIDSARLYDALKISERRSSQLAQRQAFLAEAGQIMNSTLDPAHVLKNLAEILVPKFSDWCQIFILGANGIIEPVTTYCEDPLKLAILSDLNKLYPPEITYLQGPGHVIRTGQIEHFNPMTDAILESMSQDHQHYQLLKKLEADTYIAVPLKHRDKIIGCLKLVSTADGHQLTEEDLQFAQDLARRVSLAMDNAELYAEAQKLNRIKDEFLATLSHELRTPLNVILGHSEILMTETDIEPEESLFSLKAIHRNALMQNQIIGDLLDTSAIMTGKISFEPTLINPNQIILEATENIRFAAESKGQKLSFKSEAPDILILSDSLRLQQIIWNLLSNAVKFTPSEGQIDVQLRSTEKHAVIEVKDSGQGMDAHFLPYVFDRFRQEDSSLTRNFGGLGLGLSIVRQLIELHGGLIEVQSEGKGLGSLFRVIIPKAPKNKTVSEAEPIVKPTSEANKVTLEGLKILVVDDEVDAIDLMAQLLARAHGKIEIATSASSALDKYREFKPDILVSDIGMPVQDGYSLIQKIREIDSDNKSFTPAIALTAYAREDDKRKALEAGFQVHLSKPISSKALIQVIKDLAVKYKKTKDFC